MLRIFLISSFFILAHAQVCVNASVTSHNDSLEAAQKKFVHIFKSLKVCVTAKLPEKNIFTPCGHEKKAFLSAAKHFLKGVKRHHGLPCNKKSTESNTPSALLVFMQGVVTHLQSKSTEGLALVPVYYSFFKRVFLFPSSIFFKFIYTRYLQGNILGS